MLKAFMYLLKPVTSFVGSMNLEIRLKAWGKQVRSN